MISLDEDFIGTDANTIIIRALKVCGGLLCQLNNNTLLGAHFTNSTRADEILTACTYMVNHWMGGSTVQRMWFIYNISAWEQRTDRYSNAMTLLADLKEMMRYTGMISVYDKNIRGASVDVRLDTPTTIGWRATLANDPLVPTLTNDVKLVKKSAYEGVPRVRDMGGAYSHKLPQTQGGFTLFGQGEMVPV
jgi:hypothetical protein